MAQRITEAKINVEQSLENHLRITDAKVDVEYEVTVNHYRMTKAIVMVEYRVENWRHSSVAVEMF